MTDWLVGWAGKSLQVLASTVIFGSEAHDHILLSVLALVLLPWHRPHRKPTPNSSSIVPCLFIAVETRLLRCCAATATMSQYGSGLLLLFCIRYSACTLGNASQDYEVPIFCIIS
jgi:hypothetical protein